MSRRSIITFSAIALLTSFIVRVDASGGRPVDIPERAHGAKKVVVATAASLTPSWRRNAWGDELIVTEVILQVEEAMKGGQEPFLSLALEGGTVGDITLQVSDLPSLKKGDRAVFFLEDDGRGSHVPHLRGLGILKLDDTDQVRGSSLKLIDIRRMAKPSDK